jgi:CHRD domain
MRRLNPILIAIVVGLLASATGHAIVILHANLTNLQENPPAVPTLTTGAPRPASFGTADFTLNDAQTAMSFTATVFNIDVTGSQTSDPNDNLTVAHIHAAPPGINGPVVWGFVGTPFNDTTPNDFVMTPFASGVGGEFSGKWDAPEGNNTTLTAQLDNILSGRTYMNFHTVQFGGGEIRGQIVPEASTTLSLLAAAVVALLGLKRREAR